MLAELDLAPSRPPSDAGVRPDDKGDAIDGGDDGDGDELVTDDGEEYDVVECIDGVHNVGW